MKQPPQVVALVAALALGTAAVGGCSVSVVNDETFAPCESMAQLSLDENILVVKTDSADAVPDLASCLAENSDAPAGAFDVLSEPDNVAKITGEGLLIDINTWEVTDTPPEGFDINIG